MLLAAPRGSAVAPLAVAAVDVDPRAKQQVRAAGKVPSMCRAPDEVWAAKSKKILAVAYKR